MTAVGDLSRVVNDYDLVRALGWPPAILASENGKFCKVVPGKGRGGIVPER